MSVTCLVIGSNQPLSCLLTTILTKHGVSQVESGYISATSGVAMIVSTFILSYISDSLPNYRKMIIVVTLFLSLLTLMLFTSMISFNESMKDNNELK